MDMLGGENSEDEDLGVTKEGLVQYVGVNSPSKKWFVYTDEIFQYADLLDKIFN